MNYIHKKIMKNINMKYSQIDKIVLNKMKYSQIDKIVLNKMKYSQLEKIVLNQILINLVFKNKMIRFYQINRL